MKWWIIPFAILVSGAGLVEAQARCDAKFADKAALQPDWSFTPLSASEDDVMALCRRCAPKVVAAVSGVDLSVPQEVDSIGSQIIGILTIDQLLSDAAQKKRFLDWYIVDHQRMQPKCKVAADIVGRREIDGIAFAIMSFGSRCQGQLHEFTSAIEYLGFKNSCAYRITLMWPENAPMPDASTSEVERLLRQIKWWN